LFNPAKTTLRYPIPNGIFTSVPSSRSRSKMPVGGIKKRIKIVRRTGILSGYRSFHKLGDVIMDLWYKRLSWERMDIQYLNVPPLLKNHELSEHTAKNKDGLEKKTIDAMNNIKENPKLVRFFFHKSNVT